MNKIIGLVMVLIALYRKDGLRSMIHQSHYVVAAVSVQQRLCIMAKMLKCEPRHGQTWNEREAKCGPSDAERVSTAFEREAI